MARGDLSVDQVLVMLADAPARIAVLAEGLSPAQLRTQPNPDEWSITDVLAHLRSCSDMWGGGIATILAEDRPTFRAINPTTWIKHTDYPDLEFRTSFEADAVQRADLLAVLDSLSPEGWARSGTATGAGPPLQRTVRSFAERIAIHERSHVKQIGRIAKALRG